MKRVSITPKPSTQGLPSADAWVKERKSPEERNVRLTLEVPESLHRRFKVQCAADGVVMSDVIREMLAARCPEAVSRGGAELH